jgi:uroporphyrinogen-III synthase
MASKTIAITRPSSEKDTLTGLLHERGHHVICEPVTHVALHVSAQEPLDQALASHPDAVIVTSRNAVEALAAFTELRDMVLLCVGPATGRAALAHGFSRVFIAGGTVEHLTQHIIGAYDPDSRFLYVSAEHVRIDLVAALSRQGMHIERVVVYEAVAEPQFSDTFAEHIRRGKIDAVTFLSQRSAQVFEQLAKKAKVEDNLKKIHACCMSKTIASGLTPKLWKQVHTPRNTTFAAFAESIESAFTRKKPAGKKHD